MSRTKLSACATAIILAVSAGLAHAQGRGLTEQELTDAWQRAKAVVTTLKPANDGAAATQLDGLSQQLAHLQTELENVAIRIVAVPEFSYEASNKSAELADEVGDIGKRFDALFGTLGIRERDDVQAMQASLETLRRALADQHRMERDVVNTIGSGSKTEMQQLAGEWWRVSESVESVKIAVQNLRQGPPGK